MKEIKWIFVVFSLAAVLAMCAIGIFISRGSILGIILSILSLMAIMGYGFKTKKKMRDAGTL